MPEQELRIWDPFIRLFHWSVACLFFLNHFFIEEGTDLHEVIGYLVLALVILRVIWGLIGPYNARFSSFWPSGAGIHKHLEQIKAGRINPAEGHNPAGGIMIIFLLAALLLTSLTGWMLEWEMFWGEEWLEALHEITSNAILIAVVIHVSAVIIMSKLTGYNLINTMITGKRNVKPEE